MGFAKLNYEESYYNSALFPTSGTKTETVTSSFYPSVFSLNNGNVSIISIDNVISQEKALGTLVRYSYRQQDGIQEIKNNTTGEILPNGTSTLSKSGVYSITYRIYSFEVGGNPSQTYVFTYTFSVLTNRLPIKKWTILDVINRIFDLIEPLKDFHDGSGEKPQFRLKGQLYGNDGKPSSIISGSTADRLKDILAPEFSLTRENLREQLKQVGGFIHAEPRITNVFDELTDDMWFEVDFDFYGGNEYSNIKNKRYISATFSTDINEYCTNLDSSADNLVNQLNWAQGVITEPFISRSEEHAYGISLRTDSSTVRYSETDGTFIPTSLPIYSMGGKMKVYCTYIPKPDIGLGRWDITPYIFEKADYDNLSSFEGVYPFCKAYALYYTQGAKNIKGLFFENPDARDPVFQRFAIINILEAVTGQTIGELGEAYYDLCFQIEYLPIFSQRVKTNKPYIEGGIKRELAYNQSANLIESSYYGEHLKGIVARLGNVQKTYTYNLAFLSQIPQIGQKYDDDYYISTVSCELLPTYIKCTIALSKDFNRLSSYIGINSNKRMWEVSEKQSQNRDSVFTEYLLITTNSNVKDDNFTVFGGELSGQTAKIIFNQVSTVSAPVSSMWTNRYSKDGNPAGTSVISLPVVSTAFGNSMLFSSQFEDNYSAGQKQHLITANNAVKGVWGQYVSYNDYYGRFYWLVFGLQCGSFVRAYSENSDLGQLNAARNMPQVDTNVPPGTNIDNITIANTSGFKYRYRKDSREVPNLTYELTAVTDDESIVIGSELMKNCALVNNLPIRELEVRLFTKPLPKLDTLPINQNGELGTLEINDQSITITGGGLRFVAWAICTKQTSEVIEVEDEDGNKTTQPIYSGGKILIAQNKPLNNGSTTLYLRIKSKIYD